MLYAHLRQAMLRLWDYVTEEGTCGLDNETFTVWTWARLWHDSKPKAPQKVCRKCQVNWHKDSCVDIALDFDNCTKTGVLVIY